MKPDTSSECGDITPEKLLGNEGEDVACLYLRTHQYGIRERNVRLRRDELDIVAYDPTEKMIVFVEVKTRSSHSDAYPIHTAMTQRKRRALRRAIVQWMIRKDYDGPARIDLLSVYKGKVVEHWKDVGSEFG